MPTAPRHCATPNHRTARLWAANQPAPLLAVTGAGGGGHDGGSGGGDGGFISGVVAARFFWMDQRLLIASSNQLHILRCA